VVDALLLAPISSGTAVSADGAHLLAVHAVDAAGNAADRSVRFTIVAAPSGLHQQLGGHLARTLALIRSGLCAAPAADVTRLTTFLNGALGGPDRLLVVTTDESDFLTRLRSGLYNVLVVAALPLQANVALDGCGEDLEGCDDLAGDLPAVLTRKAIAREITELVFSGHAGVVGIRARPELVPKYRAVLGVDPGGFVLGTKVRFTAAPLLPSGDLTLSRRGARLRLVGAAEAGVYQPPPLLGSDAAAAVQAYGLGKAAAFGYDPSVATAAGDAALALRRAVDWVTPADGGAPLAVLEVEIALDAGSGSATVVERVPAPLAIAGSLPAGLVSPTGDAVTWQVNLSPAAQTMLRLFARLPDARGSFPLAAERVPPSGAPATLALESAETGADLLANARAAAALLPAGGTDGLLRSAIEAALGRIAARAVASRTEARANLGDLAVAVASARLITTADPTATRLALDELVRYWEARWWLAP